MSSVLNKFIFIVILLIPFVIAETAIIDIVDVAEGEIAVVTGTCTVLDAKVGLRASIEGERIWFTQSEAIGGSFSETFLPPGKGTYTVYAACEGDFADSDTFCVGTAEECATIPPPPPDCGNGSCDAGETCTSCPADCGACAVPPVCGDDNCTGTEDCSSCPGDCGACTTPTPSPGGSPGGGSPGCIREWSCGQWSYCNVSLQQSRECTDLERCNLNKLTKTENKSCARCDESWTCRLWSECINGIQTRTCTDSHYCKTQMNKPAESRPCEEDVYQPPTYQPPAYQPPTAFPIEEQPASFWDSYGKWVGLGLLLLVILVALIFIVVHFIHKKHVIYNHAELVEWIRKEKAMGTPTQDMKEILADKTGWSEQEIHDAFGELHEEKGKRAPKQPTSQAK